MFKAPGWSKAFIKAIDPTQNYDPTTALGNWSDLKNELSGKAVDLMAAPQIEAANNVAASVEANQSKNPAGPITISDGAGGPQVNPAYITPEKRAAMAAASRDADFQKGIDFGKHYFGQGNADMAAILDARRKRALGMNGDETQRLREQGTAGINQQMATGLRAVRGANAVNGVHGGAATGASLPVVNQALAQRGTLERNIAIADQDRRSKELGDYEHTLTGERAGELGTGLGFANLGAGDRANAQQYELGKNFLDSYGGDANADVNLGISKPWHQKATQHWAEMWHQYFG